MFRVEDEGHVRDSSTELMVYGILRPNKVFFFLREHFEIIIHLYILSRSSNLFHGYPKICQINVNRALT